MPEKIHVVDSSDNDESAQVARMMSATAFDNGQLHHVSARPGLTHQRNVGVQLTSSDVIHFIDDDSVVEEDYFASLLECFEAYPAAAGLTGRITNIERRSPPMLTRLFLMDSIRPGVVLASGRPTLALRDTGVYAVDWLSGCSMSYRADVFTQHRFDEDLAGYALGEDVDFSYRLRQRRQLLAVAGARQAHIQSPAERWKRPRVVAMELAHRHVRAGRREGVMRLRAFWWSVLGLVIYRSAVLARARDQESLHEFGYALRAACRVLLVRPATYAAARACE